MRHMKLEKGIFQEMNIALIKKYEGEFPEKYFQEFLKFIDINQEHFWEVVDSWRPKHLWEKKRKRGKLKKSSKIKKNLKLFVLI